MKEYYDFVGETIDGDIIEDSFNIPLTKDEAKDYAIRLLKRLGGGHIDVMYADPDIARFYRSDFAFDVEV